MRTGRRLIGLLTVIAATLVVAPGSAWAIGVSGTVTPADTQAGAHSDIHIHMDFSGGQVKDLTVGLPPGLVGDPNATPLCTVAQLNSSTSSTDGCPADTQVGTVSVQAQVVAPPVTVTGKLYNLEPQPGEPARFGIVLHPLSVFVSPIILQSAVKLRSDFGLDTLINNIPNKTVVDGDTTILSQDITLFGTAPGTGKSFMRNPTSCGPATTTFSAVPYSGSPGSGTASFTPTNCGALDFSPSFSAQVGGPGQTAAGKKTTAVTSIDQDLGEAGLIKAQVAIPPDLNPDVNLLGNRCSPADFAASNCPPASVMGSAIASSPLLSQPLAGNVVLIDTGAVPNFGLDLQGQLHLQLQGSLGLDKVVTFDGLPDIPIAHFQLTFASPPGLLTASRNLCTPPAPVLHADFFGYNGATASVDAHATVLGCGPAKKCKKASKKKHKRSAFEAKKKHKHKKRCVKKKKRKHRK
jgi:hypothetical protein